MLSSPSPTRSPLRFMLYERAVTDAPRLAAFARAAHGGKAVTLREDFSGTAALARAWVAMNPAHRAVAVDHDLAVTRYIPRVPRLRVVTSDVRRCRARADITAATNFAVGYFHERAALLTYLRHARRCLAARGVFLCDMYDGEGSLTPGKQRVTVRTSPPPRGRGREAGCFRAPTVPPTFTYTWHQRRADPLTNLVENSIHFSWREGARTRRIDNAFTYHWRLWSIPELRDAMLDAGFRAVEVYTRLADAVDHEGNTYISPAESVEPSWVVHVVAHA